MAIRRPPRLESRLPPLTQALVTRSFSDGKREDGIPAILSTGGRHGSPLTQLNGRTSAVAPELLVKLRQPRLQLPAFLTGGGHFRVRGHERLDGPTWGSKLVKPWQVARQQAC